MQSTEAEGRATARTALAGNPSDGYRGAVLAVEVPAFAAVASARAGDGTVEPASELVAATVARFARRLAPEASSAGVRWGTTIPRSVGLGGSSAVVIATVRALCSLHDVAIEPAALSEFALAVERKDLSIPGGRQDAVAQAHGGLTFMDFGPPEPHYEALDPSLLPPLLIAWREDSGEHSGVVHGDLRARFDAGDGGVRAELASLARGAHQARAALLAGDHARFGRCVDDSFDARRRMLALDPEHVEMIECARACGACANYTGSGGAIVAACRDDTHRERVAAALDALACGVRAL
jgi:glucuronokinase